MANLIPYVTWMPPLRPGLSLPAIGPHGSRCVAARAHSGAASGLPAPSPVHQSQHQSTAPLACNAAAVTVPPPISEASRAALHTEAVNRAPEAELGLRTDFHEHFDLQGAQPLGRGQFGVVYRARHLSSARQVAVKVIPKDRADRSRAEHLATIMREITLWQSLQRCRHVVRVEGVFEDSDCVYLVQTLARGGDLRAVLEGKPLSEQETASVMRSVLEVIVTCHAHDHIHGDCKPANFLLLHPHRSTGGREFPTQVNPPEPEGPGTLSDFHAQHSSTSCDEEASSFHACPIPSGSPPPAASDTTLQHLHASFELPAAPGAAASPQPYDTAAVGHQTTHTTAASSSDNELFGSTASVPEWLRVLREAYVIPEEELIGSLSTGTSDESVGTSDESVAQLVVGHQGIGDIAWLSRCGWSCGEELVVLATDFGCAQPLHPVHKKSVLHKRRIGSPVYMAPEMWQAGAHVGPAVDVWAAGVMMYQLLSGRYPFWCLPPSQVDSMQPYQIVCGIQSNPIDWKGKPWETVSGQCKTLLAAMLNRDPEERISAEAALRHPWFQWVQQGNASGGVRPTQPNPHRS